MRVRESPLLARLGLLCALAVACTATSEQRDDRVTDSVQPSNGNPNAFWADVGVPFDPESVEVGDTIGSLVVERVGVQRAFDSTAVGSVWFRGELNLAGQMIPHVDADVHETCFEADSISAARMPRWKGDSRRPWFCFRGEAGAVPPTSVMRGPARVLVDGFAVHFSMSDAVNQATLRRVFTTSTHP